MMACLDDIWFVLAFLLFSLLIGIIGFRLFCGCNWYDALCCASITLGGNYTMNKGDPGVLFISLFSIYGSLIFFAIAAIIVNKLYYAMHGEEEKK